LASGESGIEAVAATPIKQKIKDIPASFQSLIPQSTPVSLSVALGACGDRQLRITRLSLSGEPRSLVLWTIGNRPLAIEN
jgi:hypothetical protein